MGKITYNELEDLKSIKHDLMKDLIEYGKKDGKLHEVDTLAHAIKNICKIIEESEMELEKDEYSGRVYRPIPTYSMGVMPQQYMMPNYAMAMDGNSGRHRDSMGRYAAAGHNSNLVSELYSVMGSAQNERERDELQNLINRLQQ